MIDIVKVNKFTLYTMSGYCYTIYSSVIINLSWNIAKILSFKINNSLIGKLCELIRNFLWSKF